MTVEDIARKIEEYIQTPSVIFAVKPFYDHIEREFKNLGFETIQGTGILSATRKGSKNPKTIVAHADRQGIITNDEIKFEHAPSFAAKYHGNELTFTEDFFRNAGLNFMDEAVYAYGISGKKLAEGRVKRCSYNPAKKELTFDIEGMETMQPWVPLAFKSKLRKENGELSSQLDNTVSIAAAYQLAKDGFDGSFLFPTDNLCGASTDYLIKHLVENYITTQELIILDTIPCDQQRALDAGSLMIKSKDRHGEFNARLIRQLKYICDSNRITYDTKDEHILKEDAKTSETELGKIIRSTRGKCSGATIQIPTMYHSTNHETISEKAISNLYELLKKIA